MAPSSCGLVSWRSMHTILALVLTGLLSAPPPPALDTAVLTGFLAQGAAADPRADVLTSVDLRNALDLEAQKQLAACSEGSSCLAEIAQALDAEVVLSSAASRIDEEWVLQVSAYDARKASSAGRRLIRASSQKDLATQAQAAGAELLQGILASRTGSERLRVLVLDAATTISDLQSLSQRESDSPFGMLGMGGGVVAGFGVVTTLAGVGADVVATTRPESVKDATTAATARSAAGILYPVGLGVILLGAAMVVVDGVAE